MSSRYTEGVRVELFEVEGEMLQPLSAATIGADGRADLVSGRPLAVCHCELRFQLAGYFRQHGVAVRDPPQITRKNCPEVSEILPLLVD